MWRHIIVQHPIVALSPPSLAILATSRVSAPPRRIMHVSARSTISYSCSNPLMFHTPCSLLTAAAFFHPSSESCPGTCPLPPLPGVGHVAKVNAALLDVRDVRHPPASCPIGVSTGPCKRDTAAEVKDTAPGSAGGRAACTPSPSPSPVPPYPCILMCRSLPPTSVRLLYIPWGLAGKAQLSLFACPGSLLMNVWPRGLPGASIPQYGIALLLTI